MWSNDLNTTFEFETSEINEDLFKLLTGQSDAVSNYSTTTSSTTATISSGSTSNSVYVSTAPSTATYSTYTIDTGNPYYNNYGTSINGTVTLDSGDLKIDGKSLKEILNGMMPCDENNEKKDRKVSMFNFDFGAVRGDNVHISMFGVAIKNKDGRWVSYDPKNHDMIDVEILNFQGQNFLYKMPVAVNEVQCGDVIVHGKIPMFVTGLEYQEDGKNIRAFEAIDPYAGEIKTIIPTKNMFNFNFVTKIISMVDALGGIQASEDQPFGNMLPMLLMAGDGNIDPMAFVLMQNGEMDQNNMWLLMAMMDKNNSKDMLPLFMLMNKKK